MTDIVGVLAVVQKVVKPLYSIVKATGPFIIAQSKKTVENYSDFKLNKAHLEAYTALIQKEAENLSNDKSKVRERLMNSTGLERVRAQNDFDALNKEINKFSTLCKVKDFFNKDDELLSDVEISDAWIDRFNDVASSLNEEWRQKLLAKAFAFELQKPGTVSIILLNCMASLDEETFRVFGELINMSLICNGSMNCIPSVLSKDVATLRGESYSIDKMLHSIGHLNLINTSKNTYIPVNSKENSSLTYGSKTLLFRLTDKRVDESNLIHPLFFTTLGDSMSNFYERLETPQGISNYDDIKEEVISKGYLIEEVKK